MNNLQEDDEGVQNDAESMDAKIRYVLQRLKSGSMNYGWMYPTKRLAV